MTKCVNCILSYLVMFILENIKLIKDEMISYLLEYLIETYYYPESSGIPFLASNLPLLPLFGGGGGIQINIFVWYTKRVPYNMLIGVLIASSLTPHRLLMPPHPLLNDSSLTPQRPYITKRIKVIFSMDKVDVEVYIFPPFFEIVDRMCIGILFRSEGISHKIGCDVIQHGQPDMGVLRHGWLS